MGVRSYASVDAFLEVVQAARRRSEIRDRVVGGGIAGEPRLDSELFGGRYFVASDNSKFVVLEAQASGAVAVASAALGSLEQAGWLADGPYPDGLSTGARRLLAELASAGRAGVRDRWR